MLINEVLIYEERLNAKPIISPAIKTLDKVFKDNNHEMRIVGGAVRDIALGKSPKDIDFATDATPDEMMSILDKADIRHKPTGLEHGTITAIIDNEPFEITTLRADTETDGRHAKVEFVKSWEEDAKRRDLTYNAMSMDIEGNVYDYFGGMDDLQDKVSKFVGDAEERITEDYLRILRYFRFQGRLSKPTWDKDTLQAITKHAKGLSGISAERIWQEMSKVLSGQNVASVVSMIEKTGVSKVIGLSTNNINSVKDKSNPVLALAQLDNSVDLAKRWKLSNVETELLNFLIKHKNNPLDQKKVEDMIADGVNKDLISALATMQGKKVNTDAKVPDFPVTGADLIAKGMKPGPEMGATLNKLKQQWKASNFTATKDDLLKEDADLSTERGRLEYYLKKPIAEGMLVRLYKLGKFHQGADPLAEIIPERNGGFALHPDKWESTFYSLTNKDFKKIGYYKPIIIEAPANMIVADMAIANQFYRTDDPNERNRLANAYKDSMGKDISSMKMPEVILPSINEKITKNTSMADVIKDFYNSDAPQFKGKSKKKRREMAIAAKLSMESLFEDLDPKSELYVDMDGVLADFFGVWNKMMGVNHWKDIKNIDQALQKIKDTDDFWINLPMTPNGKTLLNAIKKFKGKYNILSAPLPGDPNSEPQKRAWIKKHLGMFPPAKIIIDHNKAAYAKQADGTPNALIDDFGDNISKWRNAGGVGIQHKDIEVGDTISKLEKELEDGQEPVEEKFADGKKNESITEKTQSPAQWQKAMIKKYSEDGWYDIADAVRDYYESNAILNNTISDIIKIKNDHPSFTDYSGITKLYRYEKKDKNSAPTDNTFIPFAYNIKGAKNFVQSMAQGNMGFKKSDFELVEKDFNPGDAILNFTNLIELVHNAEDDDGEWYKREYEVWMKRTPYYTGTQTNENFADGKKKGKKK